MHVQRTTSVQVDAALDETNQAAVASLLKVCYLPSPGQRLHTLFFSLHASISNPMAAQEPAVR